MSTGSSGKAIPALGLILFALTFFRSPLFRDRSFVHTDFHQTFEPLAASYRAAWERGSTAWNPRLGNGTTIRANPVYSPLYPARILVLPFEPARGLTLAAVAHIIIAALGAYALALTLGISTRGAFLAALVFGFSGPTVSTISTCSFLWTSAWMPWVLRGVERVRTAAPHRSRGALVALAIPLFLLVTAGEPFVIASTALAALALVTLNGTKPGAGVTRVALRYLTVAAVVAMVAAPALLALLRYFPVSVRAAGFVPQGIVQWSLHPLATLGLVLSDPFGDPNAYGPHAFWGDALEPGRRGFWVHGLFVGALSLGLATLGAATRGARPRTALVVWLGLLVLLALGRHGPFYGWIVTLPFGSSLRYPIKWLVTAMLPLGLLAGVGLDQLRPHARTALVTLLAWLVLLLGLGVATMGGLDAYLAALAPASHVDLVPVVRDRLFTSVLATSLPLGAALLALVLGRRLRLAETSLEVGIAALVAAELLTATSHLAPTVSQDFYAETPDVVRAVRADPGGHGRVHVEPLPPLRFADTPGDVFAYFAWERARIGGLIGASYGLDLAFNTDNEALSPLRYAELSVLASAAPPRQLAMLLGAAGATHVVTYRALDPAAFELLSEIPDRLEAPLRVYRNRLALPRARVVRSLTPYRGVDGLVATLAHAPDDFFRRTALVESEAVAAPLPGAAEARAEVREDRGSSLHIAVRGEGGFVVVSDSFVPGWTATVDGQPVELLRADHTFRAVAIPKGEHEVVMTYAP